MGVMLTVEGVLVGGEFRAASNGDGQFADVALLPTGSRSTLELWGFGDGAAEVELVERFAEKGVGTPAVIRVDLEAKNNRLKGRIMAVTTADGSAWVQGKVGHAPRPVAAPAEKTA